MKAVEEVQSKHPIPEKTFILSKMFDTFQHHMNLVVFQQRCTVHSLINNQIQNEFFP